MLLCCLGTEKGDMLGQETDLIIVEHVSDSVVRVPAVPHKPLDVVVVAPPRQLLTRLLLLFAAASGVWHAACRGRGGGAAACRARLRSRGRG